MVYTGYTFFIYQNIGLFQTSVKSVFQDSGFVADLIKRLFTFYQGLKYIRKVQKKKHHSKDSTTKITLVYSTPNGTQSIESHTEQS